MTNMMDPRMMSGLAPELFERVVKGNPPRILEGGMISTGAVRLSWPSLSKPAKVRNPGDKPKYQAAGLFPHNNVGPIMEALRAAVRAAYPSLQDPNVLLNPRDKNHPMKDQGLKVNVADGGLNPMEKSMGGYVPGLPFFNAKSMRPIVCIRRVAGREVVVVGEDVDTHFYAGCWVDAKLLILKSTAAGNPGVFWGLQGLFKLADDTRFEGSGGGASPEDFASAVSIEDPNENQIMQSSAAQTTNWG